jgi:hypothetical protein
LPVAAVGSIEVRPERDLVQIVQDRENSALPPRA